MRTSAQLAPELANSELGESPGFRGDFETPSSLDNNLRPEHTEGCSCARCEAVTAEDFFYREQANVIVDFAGDQPGLAARLTLEGLIDIFSPPSNGGNVAARSVSSPSTEVKQRDLPFYDLLVRGLVRRHNGRTASIMSREVRGMLADGVNPELLAFAAGTVQKRIRKIENDISSPQ